MEQIELCLLHVYSDSDFILQKAKKHMGHMSLGGQLLPAGQPHPPAYLPACLPLFPLPYIPWHGSGRPRDGHTWDGHTWDGQTWGQEKGQRSSVAAWDALS